MFGPDRANAGNNKPLHVASNQNGVNCKDCWMSKNWTRVVLGHQYLAVVTLKTKHEVQKLLLIRRFPSVSRLINFLLASNCGNGTECTKRPTAAKAAQV